MDVNQQKQGCYLKKKKRADLPRVNRDLNQKKSCPQKKNPWCPVPPTAIVRSWHCAWIPYQAGPHDFFWR